MACTKKLKTIDYIIHPEPSFNISFILAVSLNTEELKAQLTSRFKKWQRPLYDIEGTKGMFSPTIILGSHTYKGDFTSDTFGTMFLAETELTPEYIAHECLHAAFAYDRFVRRFNMHYGEDCNDDEERIAYYLMYCIKNVTKILIDNKHLKGTT